MRYRNIRKRATGQWIDVLFTVAGDKFHVRATSHRASIADALGVLRTSLEVVDSDSDQRSGVLLPQALAIVEPTDRERYLAATTDEERLSIIAHQLGLTYEVAK